MSLITSNTGLSYINYKGMEKCVDWTVHDLVKYGAQKFPDVVAIKIPYQKVTMTFEEAYEMIKKIAKGMIALGLKKGDHVGIWMPNRIEYFISYLAAQCVGFVAVNLNSRYKSSELGHAILKTDIKLLIIGHDCEKADYYGEITKLIAEIENHKCCTPLNCSKYPKLKFIISTSKESLRGTFTWDDILNMSKSDNDEFDKFTSDVNSNDICTLQFTSGTTGNPKAAVHTHFNMVNTTYFLGKRMELYTNNSILACPVPFYHLFGTALGMYSLFHFGNTIIIPAEFYSSSSTLDAINQEQCTVMSGTPTMFYDLVTLIAKLSVNNPNLLTQVRSLQKFIYGGSVINTDLLTRMDQVFDHPELYVGYGMSETGINFIGKTNGPKPLKRNVGFIQNHTEIKVVDNSGKMVPIGTPGNALIRGHSCMKGYYNDEVNTKKIMSSDGWIETGDRFVLNEDGQGQVIGRIKDTIIRGGENIEPIEVEEFLITNPCISDVQVYGVFDQRLGEVVAASIIKTNDHIDLTEEGVKEFCRGKVGYTGVIDKILVHHE